MQMEIPVSNLQIISQATMVRAQTLSKCHAQYFLTQVTWANLLITYTLVHYSLIIIAASSNFTTYQQYKKCSLFHSLNYPQNTYTGLKKKNKSFLKLISLRSSHFGNYYMSKINNLVVLMQHIHTHTHIQTTHIIVLLKPYSKPKLW